MEQPLPDTDLVVSTPERVSFDYQVAGLGTRGIAQILDLLIVAGLLIAVAFFAFAAGAATQNGTVANLVLAFGFFIVIFGYFWISEALFSGQTLGKRAFRLRAVGDRGEPLTWVQAGIRNVVRIVDFLPYGYGVGVVVLFANGRGKRLGDLAAGTVVVKDSDHIGLWQLARRLPVPGASAPASSAARSRLRAVCAAGDPVRTGLAGRAHPSPPRPRAATLRQLVRPAPTPAAARRAGAACQHSAGQPAHGPTGCLRAAWPAGRPRPAREPLDAVDA